MTLSFPLFDKMRIPLSMQLTLPNLSSFTKGPILYMMNRYQGELRQNGTCPVRNHFTGLGETPSNIMFKALHFPKEHHFYTNFMYSLCATNTDCLCDLKKCVENSEFLKILNKISDFIRYLILKVYCYLFKNCFLVNRICQLGFSDYFYKLLGF